MNTPIHDSHTTGPELTVIIPAYNENDNITPLYQSLCRTLTGIHWEAIVVDDDSPDCTWQTARQLAQHDPRIRCIRRIGRRGLASAFLEGVLASHSPFIAVMDADMQHDETLLPAMLQRLREGQADLVIGSRYTQTGSTGTLAQNRVAISRLATRLGQWVLPQTVTDPMSGFFMAPRAVIESRAYRLKPGGFKILLDLLSIDGANLNIQELPYTMRARHAGESKLDSQVIWEYLTLVVRRLIGRWLPETFVLFALVGLSGVAVHMSVLGTLHHWAGMPFLLSQIIGTLVAMTSNYWLNNRITFRHQRLRNAAFFSGLLQFYLYCSLGAFIGISAAEFLYQQASPWWFAGLCGTFVSALWNYVLNATFTWRTSARVD
jgi:dolichol-phosphate mannosyltransferase